MLDLCEVTLFNNAVPTAEVTWRGIQRDRTIAVLITLSNEGLQCELSGEYEYDS